MRLRHDRKQNHPKKKTEEKVTKPSDELGFLKGGSVPKKPKLERGVPVPAAWRRWRIPTEPVYSDGQVAAAKGLIEETSTGEWPGPSLLSYLPQFGSGEKPQRWKLDKVYRVKHDDARFYAMLNDVRKRGFDPNVTRLYHGTAETSITGVVLKGLIQGKNYCMFGRGIYLAPDIYKAASYTGHEVKYIFSVNAVLGNVKVMSEANHNVDGDQLWLDGYQSVGGAAGKTITRGDAKLLRDEYCVYFRDQVRIRSLACYRLVKEVK